MLYEKYTLDVPYEKAGVSSEGCEAVLTAFVPDKLPNDCRDFKRKSIIICPGGGYDYCSVREAEPVAVRFMSYGITAFVLNYSCYRKPYPTNLLELGAAVKFVRDNAEKFGIDPDKIFVTGFSAGGHLAGSLAVHWNKPYIYEALGVNKEYIRPCGAILNYPVITSGEKRHHGSIVNLAGEDMGNEMWQTVSLEKQVTSETVPVFIWSTFDDETVPVENTLLFTSALAANKVPFTSHIFSSGVHGLSLCDDSTANYDGHINSECAQWVRLALDWLNSF